ncbi:MAG: efflux RND transporter periplasmic adaptor subunit [Steroidobacteraceae bacterium]
MDVERANPRMRRRRKGWALAIGIASVAAIGAAGVYLDRLPPSVDSSRLWQGVVTRGELIREVTASGTLVAPQLRAVTNRTEGVVERIRALPGQLVQSGTVLMDLSNPQAQADAAKARLEYSAAQAALQLSEIDAADRGEDIAADLASAQADYTSSRLELEAKERLPDVFAAIDIERIRLKTQELKKRLEAQQARNDSFTRYRKMQAIQAHDTLAEVRGQLRRAELRVADLEVRAGLGGVVQEVDVQPGERVALGQSVAKIVNPSHLLARIGVSEQDARLVRIGQPVRLEVGSQVIAGRVQRIDPTVQNDLVNVDVALSSDAPADLRPQLSATARIELEHVRNVLVLERPAALRGEFQRIELYRVAPDGHTARRVSVQVGRASDRQVEIVGGLRAGDEVILSDLSEVTMQPLIRLR